MRVRNLAPVRFLRQRRASRKLRRQLQELSAGPLRLVLGSAGIHQAGWIPTDVDTLDLLQASQWLDYVEEASAEAMFAEHVWEHLTLAQGEIAAQTCCRFLKPGGHLRVAVPDANHPDDWYIRYCEPGGFGAGAHDHKVFYNSASLGAVLLKGGFQEVRLLEYYDEEGEFHAEEWDIAGGKVRRSIRFDDRKTQGGHPFTSLIIDAIK